MNGFWKFERKWEKVFQQLQFNQVFVANHYFIKFACRDINFASLLFKNINFRAFKRVSSWQGTLLYRDIKLLVATYSTFGGTSHPMATTANISSMYYDVATTSSWRNCSCRDFCLFLPSILTESQHQSLSRTSQYLP